MKRIKANLRLNVISGILAMGYPILIFSICVWMGSKNSHSGNIRKVFLSGAHPGTVTLAAGHTTALSFTSKPDRVVVGAPEKVHVDFLGNDVIVTPTGKEPGNLLIYTKTGRYVVLFQMGGATHYDDVVEVREGSANGSTRTIHLLEDSFGVETLKITRSSSARGSKKYESQLTAWVSRDGRTISSESLGELLESASSLQCGGCLVRKRTEDHGLTLVCSAPITTLNCQGPRQLRVEIKRVMK